MTETLPPLPELRSDCSACAALCCMALAFDAGDDFAIDKPAGLPCPNLDEAMGCRLYGRLEAEGFAGCARYECAGAGQRVSQELFEGADWRTDPALAAPMIEAFAAMRKVHEGLELLVAAGRLDLPEPLERERRAILAAYLPESWSLEALRAFVSGGAPTRLAAFLPKLRDWV
ncbi:MAG: hypothetical protein D6801_03205 [Alphaproteobacteria bacterium]|nr:MAG: hypothetical protein D6801_03205 [Alphaproteobacteria bacterium]